MHIVCPHAVIRPVALSEEEAAKAPAGMQRCRPLMGLPGYEVRYGTVSASRLHRLRRLAHRSARAKKGAKALVMKATWIRRMQANSPCFDYAVKESMPVTSRKLSREVQGDDS